MATAPKCPQCHRPMIREIEGGPFVCEGWRDHLHDEEAAAEERPHHDREWGLR